MAEADARDYPEVTVVSREWETDRGGPPQLALRLSSGVALVIRWDAGYACRRLIAYGEDDKPRDVTPRDVGLPESVLAPLVDEVADAVVEYERQEDDSNPPQYSYADRCFGSGR